MNATIRKIEARDRKRWGELWEGYCRFYERDLSGPVTEYTWNRIVDTASPVHAIVAETPADGVIGEWRRAEVALARVGQHAQDIRALLRLGGHSQPACEGRARGNADKDAFLRSQVLAAADAFRPRDLQKLVEGLHVHGVAGQFR